MLESERWSRMRQLADGEPAPPCDVSLTWWQGSRQVFDRAPNVVQRLTTQPTPFWVAEFTVGDRQLFAEIDQLPDAPRSELHLVGWPEIGGVVAFEGGGHRVVAAQPVAARRPRRLTVCA